MLGKETYFFIPMQPTRINSHINYTGEGFSGEKFLAIASVSLTIASTILLIILTVKQHEQTKIELAKLKAEDNNKTPGK